MYIYIIIYFTRDSQAPFEYHIRSESVLINYRPSFTEQNINLLLHAKFLSYFSWHFTFHLIKDSNSGTYSYYWHLFFHLFLFNSTNKGYQNNVSTICSRWRKPEAVHTKQIRLFLSYRLPVLNFRCYKKSGEEILCF